MGVLGGDGGEQGGLQVLQGGGGVAVGGRLAEDGSPHRNGRDARSPSATDKMSVVPVRRVRRPRTTTADARERVPPAAKMAALHTVSTSATLPP